MHINNKSQLNGLPDTMKAIVLEQPNQNMALSEIRVPLPQCDENEILVRVEAVGLTPFDVCCSIKGFPQWQYPHVLGLDAVGIVVQAPKGLFPNVGDKVMWHANIAEQGVLSEYAKVPNFAVSVVPTNISSASAAAIPCPGMSALIALEKTKVIEGDTVLIENGATTFGQYAIQSAKQRGAIVFTTTTKKHFKLAKRLGVEEVFDCEKDNLIDSIRSAIGPQGFDVVIDSTGGETTIRNIELLRFCGRIACLKSLPTFSDELMFRQAPSLSIVSLAGAWLSKSVRAQQRMAFMKNALLEGVANGEILVPELSFIDFNANSISQALRLQSHDDFAGKQIVKIAKDC